MYRFCVWVDADSFPARARAFLVELAVSKSVRVVFVANRDIKTNNKTVQMIVCQKEKDSADNYIFENAGANDIVVTRDLLFAERLVSKKITVMNDRGVVLQGKVLQINCGSVNLALISQKLAWVAERETIMVTKNLKSFLLPLLKNFKSTLLQTSII